MAIIDIERDVIVVRIVYDGPPFSGKTTSVHALAKILDKRDTVFSPQEDPSSKTLYFDWMEYCGGFFKGYSISCQIVSVPGQLSLMERRHLLLRTADSVIFVLDASEANTEIALTYFNDLRRLLSPAENHFFPVIIQANKQDKPKALSALQLKSTLFPDYPNIKIVDSTAISGKGIREAFVLAVRLALERSEALMVKGQLEHGRPQIDSGEGLFTQLQQDLFFQNSQLKSESLPLVESKSPEQMVTDTTSVTRQPSPEPLTTESTLPIDAAAYSTADPLEQLDSEPTIAFEQLDNNQEDFVAADDSITATLPELIDDTIELSEITAIPQPLPNSELELNELSLESSVELFALEDPDDEEWDGEIEPLLGTEAFTAEEEEFFNQLIASSQFTEEEIEEDLEESFYPEETADVTLTTLEEPLTGESSPFNELDNIDETVTADLSIAPLLTTTTDINEISYSESKTFEDLAKDNSNIVLDTVSGAESLEPLSLTTTVTIKPELPPSTSTPETLETLEPLSSLEPPRVKDWLELDDSELSELPPTELTTDESEVELEISTSTPETLEPPTLLESPSVKDKRELDDSELSKLVSTEPMTVVEAATEVETHLLTPETLESTNLPEPPLVKDGQKLDDSKPSQTLFSELTTTESVAAAEATIAKTEPVIESQLSFSEPQEVIVAESLGEQDDSEITSLPLVTKETVTEPNRSSQLSLPLIPNESISNQWIWPPLAGKNWVKTVFHAPIKTIQEAKEIWLIETTDNWSGFSKAEWLYHDIQLAKQALHEQIRLHLQCSPILSEKRAIIIATDNKSWRLWQLVQRETTLANHLLRALQEETMNKLALEVFRCVSHYAEVYLRCSQYPSCLELNLENIGSNQKQQLIYIGIVDLIHQENELTQARLLESIKHLLVEPIKLVKSHLNIGSIINELEKIDGFEQQYLLEALVQLFQQM